MLLVCDCEGQLGRSAAHCLTCSLFPVLQRSHANMFAIRTVASLGEVTAVRLWHYNLGSHPKWLVSPPSQQSQPSHSVICIKLKLCIKLTLTG